MSRIFSISLFAIEKKYYLSKGMVTEDIIQYENTDIHPMHLRNLANNLEAKNKILYIVNVELYTCLSCLLNSIKKKIQTL